MISLWDVLKASKGLPVSDLYAAMWGRKMAVKYTVTELEGTLPMSIVSAGKPLMDYRIYGNTEQTGTPTPENPIMPESVGERTENLFNLYRQRSNTFVLDSTKYIYGALADRQTTYPQQITELAYNNDSFTILTTSGAGIGFLVEVEPNTTYTVSYQCDITVSANRTSAALNLITSDSTFGTFWAIYGDNRSSTFTTNANTAYVYLVFRAYELRATYSNIMLVEGSTALPYEPYGYKLPILSNSTVTNIYLGEVETTRRIKKLVLTGTEDWRNQFGVSLFNGMGLLNTHPFIIGFVSYSSHYVYNPIQTGFNDGLKNGEFGLQRGANYNLFFKDTRFTRADDFKFYLAAQYAAGTPVTIWYVLAEPEIGIVNEPIMKIGDYADTVSMEQAGVSIPTNNGSTVIDYDGALKPSQMYIKYLGVKND